MGTKAELIRQEIIKTADELFYHKGYENTSFKNIADAVGISRGNFYYHFKSKDDILNAVIDLRISFFKQMLCDWDKTIKEPLQRLYYFIDMQLRNQENLIEYGCPVGTLCTELARTEHTYLSHANKMFVVLRDWLAEQFRALGFNEQAYQLSMHLLARGQGIAMLSHAFEDKEFLNQEVNELKSWLDNQLNKLS